MFQMCGDDEYILSRDQVAACYNFSRITLHSTKYEKQFCTWRPVYPYAPYTMRENSLNTLKKLFKFSETTKNPDIIHACHVAERKDGPKTICCKQMLKLHSSIVTKSSNKLAFCC